MMKARVRPRIGSPACSRVPPGRRGTKAHRRDAHRLRSAATCGQPPMKGFRDDPPPPVLGLATRAAPPAAARAGPVTAAQRPRDAESRPCPTELVLTVKPPFRPIVSFFRHETSFTPGPVHRCHARESSSAGRHVAEQDRRTGPADWRVSLWRLVLSEVRGQRREAGRAPGRCLARGIPP